MATVLIWSRFDNDEFQSCQQDKKRASRAAQVRDPIQDSGSPDMRSWASQAMRSGNYYDPYPEVLVIAP